MWRIIPALFALMFGANPLLAADVCPFLTNEEVEKVTNRKLLFKLTLVPLPGNGTLCDSNIASVIVFVGPHSEQRFEEMMEGSGRKNDDRVPITSLGDRAYALHLEPRNDNEYPTTIIVVVSEQGTAAISVRAKKGDPADVVKSQAIELAKIVMTKLP